MRFRAAGRMRRDHNDLSRMYLTSLDIQPRKRKWALAFKDDKFTPRIFVKLEQDSKPADRSRGDGSIDFDRSSFFGRVHQNCAITQFVAMRFRSDVENRVGAEAGNPLI